MLIELIPLGTGDFLTRPATQFPEGKRTVPHTRFIPSNQIKWLDLFQEGRSLVVERGVRQAPYGQKGGKTKARTEPPLSAAARVTLAQLCCLIKYSKSIKTEANLYT